ncbi:MAG: hypothetical protein QMD08_00085 [Actinomycetota bacterium]|nr:hypothetical protein [Actinomycetota bacterium]
MQEQRLTNSQKWVIAIKQGLVFAALFFAFALIFQIRTKIIRVELSFWELYRSYDVNDLIFWSFLYGLVMAYQKRLFFTKRNSFVWLWPLLLIFGTFLLCILAVIDACCPMGYFYLWVIFSGLCLVLLAINKILQVLHNKKYG